jgi:hypothetical protein
MRSFIASTPRQVLLGRRNKGGRHMRGHVKQEEKYIQGFGGEISRKETILKTWA